MRCGKYREGVILNESRMKMAVFMEDRKIQLTEWEGPDGCISTKRVAVEKMQVGFCYRTKPAGRRASRYVLCRDFPWRERRHFPVHGAGKSGKSKKGRAYDDRLRRSGGHSFCRARRFQRGFSRQAPSGAKGSRDNVPRVPGNHIHRDAGHPCL